MSVSSDSPISERPAVIAAPRGAVGLGAGREAPAPRIAPTDGELLALFTRSADSDALDKLVDRHAAMVWRVCRQSLRRQQDAEDAFQATFLMLVKNARQIGASDSAAGWLYRVAYRTSIRARKRLAQRREESLALDPTAPSEAAFPDLSHRQTTGVLAEELMQLPERYQTPLVMRYLEGQSRRAIADATDETIATVQGRLARGKQLLRRRLARRGVSLSVAMAAITAKPQAAHAVAPAQVVLQTTSNATVLATGGSLAASAAVVTLLQQGTRAMLLASITKPLAGAAACGLAAMALLANADDNAPSAATLAPAGVVLDAAVAEVETDAAMGPAALQLAAKPTAGGEPEASAPGEIPAGDSADNEGSWRPGDENSVTRLQQHQWRLSQALQALKGPNDEVELTSQQANDLLSALQRVNERIARLKAPDDYVASVLSVIPSSPTGGEPESTTPGAIYSPTVTASVNVSAISSMSLPDGRKVIATVSPDPDALGSKYKLDLKAVPRDGATGGGGAPRGGRSREAEGASVRPGGSLTGSPLPPAAAGESDPTVEELLVEVRQAVKKLAIIAKAAAEEQKRFGGAKSLGPGGGVVPSPDVTVYEQAGKRIISEIAGPLAQARGILREQTEIGAIRLGDDELKDSTALAERLQELQSKLGPANAELNRLNSLADLLVTRITSPGVTSMRFPDFDIERFDVDTLTTTVPEPSSSTGAASGTVRRAATSTLATDATRDIQKSQAELQAAQAKLTEMRLKFEPVKVEAPRAPKPPGAVTIAPPVAPQPPAPPIPPVETSQRQWFPAVATTTPHAAAGVPLLPFDKNGRPGKYGIRNRVYGHSVQQLQQRLNAVLEPSPKLDIDGDYGPKTEAAVKRFQAENGLPESGFADAATLGRMGFVAPGGAAMASPADNSPTVAASQGPVWQMGTASGWQTAATPTAAVGGEVVEVHQELARAQVELAKSQVQIAEMQAKMAALEAALKVQQGRQGTTEVAPPTSPPTPQAPAPAEKSIRETPTDTGALLKDGWKQFFSRDEAAAAELFRKVLAADPDNLSAINGLGFSLLNQGEPAEAKPLFERFLAEQPDAAGPLNGLARCLEAEGDIDGAVAIWEKLVAAQPDVLIDPVYSLARVYEKRGETEKAAALKERIAAEKPGTKEYQRRLKKLAAAAGEATRPAMPKFSGEPEASATGVEAPVDNAFDEELRGLAPPAQEPARAEAEDDGLEPTAAKAPGRIDYSDGKADGKKSLGGSGHLLRFELPEGALGVKAVRVHGSRYGTPEAPDEDFEVAFLSEDRSEILAVEHAPYGLFRRGPETWTTVRFDKPVLELPDKFWVALNFNPGRTKGVYVSYDTSTGGERSMTGTAQQQADEHKGVEFGGDWMVQAVLERE